MALQGDLNSFALPDVLRLLAGTGKSGRLAVSAEPGSGEVILCAGSITTGSISNVPKAEAAADIIFEMLRFGGGSFLFEEGEAQPREDSVAVDEAIAAAEQLVVDWTEVEAVVPSMSAWMSLAPEIVGDEAIISAEQWKALAAVAGGGTVTDLADSLSLTDLAAAQMAKGLIEASLLELRASHGYEPPSVELDSFDEFEIATAPTMTDLEDLEVEDRPVVMEESDDAMLPEPLPGEGIAYEGESITGSVDGRSFESFDTLEAFESVKPFDSTEDLAPYAPEMNAGVADAGGQDPFGDSAPFSEIAPAADFGTESTADPVGHPGDAVDGDDERGSLLRFLSTVKP